MGSTTAGTPHLLSGVIAVGLIAAILFVVRMIAIHLEHKTLHAVVPQVFQLKNQGLAFQRAAAQARDVLPLYGSSELLTPLPDGASVFFREAPTGFQASPVGTEVTTPLIMVHKLPAVARDFRGREIPSSLP